MSDIHIYLERPAGREDTDLNDLRAALLNLGHVSEVGMEPAGNVVAVTFEGGKAEQEEIERAVEEAGYGISRLSVRSEISEGTNIWDI